MKTCGLLVTLEAARDHETTVERFLADALPMVREEFEALAWFALRFENGDLGFFDAFTDSRARRKHLMGKAPRELVKQFRLLGGIPRTTLLDVRAETFAA